MADHTKALPTLSLPRNEKRQKPANVPAQIRKNCQVEMLVVGGIPTSSRIIDPASATFKPMKLAGVMLFKCPLIIALETPNAPQQRPSATGVICKHSGIAGSADCGG